MPTVGQRRAAARVRQRQKKEERFLKKTPPKPVVHAAPWNDRFAAPLQTDNGRQTDNGSRRQNGSRRNFKSHAIVESSEEQDCSTTDRADGIPIITRYQESHQVDTAQKVSRSTSPFDEMRLRNALSETNTDLEERDDLNRPKKDKLDLNRPRTEKFETKEKCREIDIDEIERYRLALNENRVREMHRLYSRSSEDSVEM